jgi:hypothetical protein
MRRICALVRASGAKTLVARGADPQVTEREHRSAGNRYTVDKKYSEADLETLEVLKAIRG